jgi:hypothetical protein
MRPSKLAKETIMVLAFETPFTTLAILLPKRTKRY